MVTLTSSIPKTKNIDIQLMSSTPETYLSYENKL